MTPGRESAVRPVKAGAAVQAYANSLRRRRRRGQAAFPPGSARPQWLSRRLSPVAWVSVLSLALAGTLAGMAVGGPWTVVALLCVFAVATGFAYPVQRKLVNDAIPPRAPRATLLSVESIVDRAVCALAAIAVGAYLSAGRLDALLWHSALAAAVLLGAFQLIVRGTVVGTGATAAPGGTGSGAAAADADLPPAAGVSGVPVAGPPRAGARRGAGVRSTPLPAPHRGADRG